MYYWTDLHKVLAEQPQFRQSKNKKWLKHNANTLCLSFDIETTSTYTNSGSKFAFCYIWQFAVEDNVFYGRNLLEFPSFLNKLQEWFNPDDKNKLTIWVHNLGFEFGFIHKLFVWNDKNQLFLSPRTPAKIETGNFIFRDSLCLTAKSLEKIGEQTKYNKLVGDLDYTLIRTPLTQLTVEEKAYCENDVLIITDYIKNVELPKYKTINSIPLTNTGRVRSYIKSNTLFEDKTGGGKQPNFDYKNRIVKAQLKTLEYLDLKQCFMGGHTHANYNFTGKIIKNVYSMDFTSSYPSVMCTEKFPMTKGIKIFNPSLKDVQELKNKNYGAMLYICVTGCKSAVDFEHIISQSKVFNEINVTTDNGRIITAEYFEMLCTDIDLDNYLKFYTFDNLEIKYMYKYGLKYLPAEFIKCIIYFWDEKKHWKAEVKKFADGTEEKKNANIELMRSKGMLNSTYGMCVTALDKDIIKYNNEEGETITTVNLEKVINKYNTNKYRFLLYQWGVWITSYARNNLYKGILELKNDYIYSDTDSVKFINYEKHKGFFDEYNKKIEQKIIEMGKYNNVSVNTFIEGGGKSLGAWDEDGIYEMFKTLGAKRYITYNKPKSENDNGLHCTVAGIGKKALSDFLMKDKNIKKAFFNFDDDLYIPPDETHKMVHTYIDKDITEVITDYQGNTSEVNALSGVHLENTSFEITMSREYKALINSILKVNDIKVNVYERII